MLHTIAGIPRHRHRHGHGHGHGHPCEDPRRHVRHVRLKLFLWQAERHADILATILARMMSARMSVSVSVSVSAPWNASLYNHESSLSCRRLGVRDTEVAIEYGRHCVCAQQARQILPADLSHYGSIFRSQNGKGNSRLCRDDGVYTRNCFH